MRQLEFDIAKRNTLPQRILMVFFVLGLMLKASPLHSEAAPVVKDICYLYTSAAQEHFVDQPPFVKTDLARIFEDTGQIGDGVDSRLTGEARAEAWRWRNLYITMKTFTAVLDLYGTPQQRQILVIVPKNLLADDAERAMVKAYLDDFFKDLPGPEKDKLLSGMAGALADDFRCEIR